MKTRRQYQGIKYPFVHSNNQGFFIDLNDTTQDKVRSQIMHVILTQKGTRIRMPDFGTNLIKYIFEPNNETTWDSIIAEVKEAVTKYVPSATIDNINILTKPEDENAKFIEVDYSVAKGNVVENNKIITKI